MSTISNVNAHALIPDGKQKQPPQAPSMWGGDGFGADDFLDLINPLQHIPVVSTLYRAATGDAISAGARLIGGGVLGGIPGLASSAANIAFESATGEDVGSALMSAAESMTGPGTPDALYAPLPPEKLRADDGSALLAVLTAAQEVPATPAEQTPTVQPESAGLPLEAARDPSLGLSDPEKSLQLRANLSRTLAKMV